MVNDPLHRVRLNGADAILMLGAEDDPETVDNIDVEVILDDGSRWSATVISLSEIGRLMDRWTTTGECLGGSFFQCPDLVIIRKGGIDEIVKLLEGLLDSDELQGTLRRLDDPEW